MSIQIHLLDDTPRDHLNQCKCLLCDRQRRFENFVMNANVKHDNTYDFTNVKQYINNRTKIPIVHKFCGTLFYQIPNSHLNGAGCSTCAGNKKLTHDEFLQRVTIFHGDEYECLTQYNGHDNDITVKHKCGLSFTMKAHDFLRNRGCWKCDGSMPLTQEEFVQRCNIKHNNGYDYTDTVYTGRRNRITIKHKKCGTVFYNQAGNHLNGQECPACVRGGYSKVSIEWLTKISNLLGINIKHRLNGGEEKIDPNSKKSEKLDGCYDPSFFKIAFEFHGDYWHGNPNVFDPNDINPMSKKPYGELYVDTIERTQKLRGMGWYVVEIWEQDYRNGLLMQPYDLFHFFLTKNINDIIS